MILRADKNSKEERSKVGLVRKRFKEKFWSAVLALECSHHERAKYLLIAKSLKCLHWLSFLFISCVEKDPRKEEFNRSAVALCYLTCQG